MTPGNASLTSGAISGHPVVARLDVSLLHGIVLERILVLKPDLLVVWRDGNSPQQLQRLSTLGIPVYASELGTLADIASTLRRLGRLAGSEAAAEARAAAYEQRLRALRERYAGRSPLRLFYQVWPRPLLTFNDRHLVIQGLALCGAKNVFGALAPLVPLDGDMYADLFCCGWDSKAVSVGVAPRGSADSCWRSRRRGAGAGRHGLPPVVQCTHSAINGHRSEL